MGDVLTYADELAKAMKLLAEDEKTLFLGQSVAYPGSIMSSSLKEVSDAKKIELPLIEDVQMGMTIGLSLEGYLPVSIYPRMDFLMCAINQLVNHLDKLEEMSRGQFRPRAIIRTAIGSTTPLYPGIQHCSDYSEALKCMLKNVEVIKLTDGKSIVAAYKQALTRQDGKSTLLVEIADIYSNPV